MKGPRWGTHTLSVSISLKLGILPAMILQKMHDSSVWMEDMVEC